MATGADFRPAAPFQRPCGPGRATRPTRNTGSTCGNKDVDCEPPGEPERQELLRLLEEEIASVREEFAYAEKANEERAAIERDACLAPEGEAWSMLLRQEAALDRSIDRKVRILLRLRKESASLPMAPAGQPDGARMERTQEVRDGDNTSAGSQGAQTAENSKMQEQSRNVAENKGSESAGINRQEAENERFSRGRSSDPLGPEFCAGRREARSEA